MHLYYTNQIWLTWNKHSPHHQERRIFKACVPCPLLASPHFLNDQGDSVGRKEKPSSFPNKHTSSITFYLYHFPISKMPYSL